MELSHKIEILFMNLTPVFITIAGIGLHEIHEILSIVVLTGSGFYSFYKIKADFFNNKNKQQ